MSRGRRGFTLIELLIVVVIIGILAAIAVPKFTSTKGKALTASMRSDLRNLVVSQDGYFFTNNVYAASITELDVRPSQGVDLEIVDAGTGGWSATATHVGGAPTTCAVFIGNVDALDPAVSEGLIRCEDS